MHRKVAQIERINMSMWTAYKEYLSTKDKGSYQNTVSRLEQEYDTVLMACFCRNLASVWGTLVELIDGCFENGTDISTIQPSVSDIQNSVWKIYKEFLKDHSVPSYTERAAGLRGRYDSDKDMGPFVQTLLISWIPIINSLKADFNRSTG